MNIVALDCSTDILAVAVARAYDPPEARGAPGAHGTLRVPKHPYREERGHAPSLGRGLVTVTIDAGYRHTERLMGAVDYCLAEAGLAKGELDLVACAEGPGSFTGLRIAMATAKGLSAGLGIPFVAVPTLDAYAAEWAGAAPVVVPVLDAKRSHFYYAVYEGGLRVGGPYDEGLESLLGRVNGYAELLFVGPDAELLDGSAADRSGFRIAAAKRRSPIASLVELAADRYATAGGAAPDAAPLYLRASDAEEAAMKG